jgi:hypothetical protein
MLVEVTKNLHLLQTFEACPTMLRRCRQLSPSSNPCYEACWAQRPRPVACSVWRRARHNDKTIAPGAENQTFSRPTPALLEQIAKEAILRAQKHCDFPYLYEHKLEEWTALRRPPPSEYRFKSGKHKGKRLDGVPDSYLVKYLMPRRHEFLRGHCTMLFDAVEDFMSRYPNVKSQAGRKKTTLLRIEDLGARPLVEEVRSKQVYA